MVIFPFREFYPMPLYIKTSRTSYSVIALLARISIFRKSGKICWNFISNGLMEHIMY